MILSPDVPDFRDLLVEAGRLEAGRHTLRTFSRLAFGDTALSIQASLGHYCAPRMTLDDLSAYTAWEVALIDMDSDRLMERKVRAVRLPLDLHGLGWDHTSVAGYVPTAAVQELLHWFWFRALRFDPDTDEELIGFEDPTYITTDE